MVRRTTARAEDRIAFAREEPPELTRLYRHETHAEGDESPLAGPKSHILPLELEHVEQQVDDALPVQAGSRMMPVDPGKRKGAAVQRLPEVELAGRLSNPQFHLELRFALRYREGAA